MDGATARPLGDRGTWATIALGAVAVATAATSAAWLALVASIGDAAGALPQGYLRSGDGLVVLVASGVTWLLHLVAAVAVIAWLRRATANARLLGADDLRFGPGWAVAGWFVPVWFLFRPYQVVADAWRASDPGLPAQASGLWADRPVPPLLRLWWGACLALLVVGVAADPSISTYADIRAATPFLLLLHGLIIGSSLLALAVVRRLTARQEGRIASVQQELAA